MAYLSEPAHAVIQPGAADLERNAMVVSSSPAAAIAASAPATAAPTSSPATRSHLAAPHPRLDLHCGCTVPVVVGQRVPVVVGQRVLLLHCHLVFSSAATASSLSS